MLLETVLWSVYFPLNLLFMVVSRVPGLLTSHSLFSIIIIILELQRVDTNMESMCVTFVL